jgi:hypothetical protein
MKVAVKITVFAFALLVLASLAVSCKKKNNSSSNTTTNTNPTPAPAPIDINHAPVVEYTVDGTAFTYPASGISGGMSTSASYAASMSGTSKASYGYSFSGSTATYFGVEKGTVYTPGIGRPDEDAFRAFFVVGNVNYAPGGTGDINGIVVEHRDPSGTMWASNKGSASQSGSVFKIEAIKETDSGYQDIKVYATFNCKLYDGNGNSKTLTNGKFVGYFENN